MDREEFIDEVELTFNMHGVDVRNSVYNAIERALGEQNDDAEICRDGNGNPEHDTDRREYERVPIGTDPREYFDKEVAPHMENAWINENTKYHDDQDGELGVVGYEIKFSEYFYQYDPPRDVEEIRAEIAELEQKLNDSIKGVFEWN